MGNEEWYGLKYFLNQSDDEIRELSQKVLLGISHNVKMGPFEATSGIILPCINTIILQMLIIPDFLNLATNFMDKKLAPAIIKLISKSILDLFQEEILKKEIIAIVGMEVAGSSIFYLEFIFKEV